MVKNVQKENKNDLIINKIKDRIKLQNKNTSTIPDLIMVSKVVEGVIHNKSLTDIAKKLGIKDIKDAEKTVLDIVAVFGTWLTHSEGKTTPVLEQMNLFDEKSSTSKIPVGFEPTSYHKRDVLKALARIKAQNPSEEVVSRFVARTYKVRSASLDHAIVAGVWGFAKRGRLDRIENVSEDAVFLQQITEAYDFINLAINDAIKFLIDLDNLVLTKRTNLNKLQDKFLNYSWVLETEFNSILKYFSLAQESDSYFELLVQNFEKFKVRISELNLVDRISALDNLSAGQIKRICANAGLQVDSSADKRAIELEIRQTLKAMKLSNDQDLLLPEALRAAEKDRLSDFWQILQNRLDGDTTWAEQLHELTN